LKPNDGQLFGPGSGHGPPFFELPMHFTSFGVHAAN
jgi:hypothetical protein